MKYIKLFEYYNQLYYEIDADDFLLYQFVDFSYTSQLERLIESRPNIEFRPTGVTGEIDYKYSDLNIDKILIELNCSCITRAYANGVQNSYKYYHLKTNHWDCFFYEVSDDWFIVSLEDMDYNTWRTFHKCDQFEGLVKLLIDFKVI